MAWSGTVGSFSSDFGSQKRWPDGTRVQNYPNPPNISGVNHVNAAAGTAGMTDGGEIQLKNITPNAANAVSCGFCAVNSCHTYPQNYGISIWL